jgi:hypothetical protein
MGGRCVGGLGSPPMSLVDVLTSDPDRKARVVADTLQLIEAEVADKKGLSGMAIRTGYGVIKNFRPDFLQRVVTDLLPRFAAAVEDVHAEAVSGGVPIKAHFVANQGRVADALLAITDGVAAKSKNRVVKGAYDRLRKIAKDHVIAAVPRLGAMVEKHAS